MNKYIFIPQCSKKIIRTIDAAHTETGGYLYGYKIGHLNFITGTTVAVSDKSCKKDYHFDLLFDGFGSVCGFDFNGITYSLET